MKITFSVAVVVGALFISGFAYAAGDAKVKDSMEQNDCFTCHAVDHQVMGPAYKDIAIRYHGPQASPATIAMLAEKIIKGGNGNWNKQTGGMPMSPHRQLPKEQAQEMVKWVLAQ